jgi:hypothetical protein
MGKNIFSCKFSKTKTFLISNVNFNMTDNKGTARLKHKYLDYILIWSIQNYPLMNQSMPGSPFPIKFSYTIMDSDPNQYNDRSLNSISGEFVLIKPSGTNPNNSDLGIEFGTYHSLGHNNSQPKLLWIDLFLDQSIMELTISGKCE